MTSLLGLLCIASAFATRADSQSKLLQPQPWPWVVRMENKGFDFYFSLTNNDNIPITFVRWGTPLGESTKGKPFKWDTFRLFNENGASPIYAGTLAKRAFTVAALLVLQPGETVSRTFTLTNGYYFAEAGRYKGWWNGSIGYYRGEFPVQKFSSFVEMGQPGGLIDFEPFDFEPVRIDFEEIWCPTPLPRPAWLPKPFIRPPRPECFILTENCDKSQSNAINVAASTTKFYASDAQNYLEAGAVGVAERYTTFFGSITTSRWNFVKDNFDRIEASAKGCQYNVDCFCNPDDIDDPPSTVFAYVFPAVCCTIHVCPVFWATTPTGTDSRAGTLIHELSHFDNIGNTDDYGYGKQFCKTAPVAQRIHNADCYEYFAENTPFLS